MNKHKHTANKTTENKTDRNILYLDARCVVLHVVFHRVQHAVEYRDSRRRLGSVDHPLWSCRCRCFCWNDQMCGPVPVDLHEAPMLTPA